MFILLAAFPTTLRATIYFTALNSKGKVDDLLVTDMSLNFFSRAFDGFD